MSANKVKIILAVVSSLPVLLGLVLVISVLAAITGDTNREPESAPVYEYQSAFGKINQALKKIDPSYVEGSSNAPDRFFLYAAYMALFTEGEHSDSFYTALAGVGYKALDTSGSEKGETLVPVTDESELFIRLAAVVGRTVTDSERKTILETRDMLRKFMAGQFLPPLFDLDFLQHITKEYGNGQNGITIAFDGITNLSARAIADGTVLTAAYDSNLGNYVLISHVNGYQSLYAHLYECNVSAGDTVSAGQILGAVSDSGNVTKPCLYLEIWKNGKPVDPRPLFEAKAVTTTTETEGEK